MLFLRTIYLRFYDSLMFPNCAANVLNGQRAFSAQQHCILCNQASFCSPILERTFPITYPVNIQLLQKLGYFKHNCCLAYSPEIPKIFL